MTCFFLAPLLAHIDWRDVCLPIARCNIPNAIQQGPHQNENLQIGLTQRTRNSLQQCNRKSLKRVLSIFLSTKSPRERITHLARYSRSECSRDCARLTHCSYTLLIVSTNFRKSQIIRPKQSLMFQIDDPSGFIASHLKPSASNRATFSSLIKELSFLRHALYSERSVEKRIM